MNLAARSTHARLERQEELPVTLARLQHYESPCIFGSLPTRGCISTFPLCPHVSCFVLVVRPRVGLLDRLRGAVRPALQEAAVLRRHRGYRRTHLHLWRTGG